MYTAVYLDWPTQESRQRGTARPRHLKKVNSSYDWSWRRLRKRQIQRKLCWGMNIKAASSRILPPLHFLNTEVFLQINDVWLQVISIVALKKKVVSYFFSTITEIYIWTSNRWVVFVHHCLRLRLVSNGGLNNETNKQKIPLKTKL